MSASTRAFKVAFRCTACGKCCTGKGGKVRVNAREVEAIADHLSTPTREFRRQFLRRHPGDDFDSIKQTPDDLQCIFLEGKQCSIYPVRPTQCQTYPFWPQQLISKYDWALTSKECEGVLLDRTSDADIVPNDRILKETVIHEVHRSGESMTYSEIESLVEELDPDMLHAFDQTGNAFVTTLLESSAELLDLVVVDVEDGTTHELLEHGDVLSAPPASMTSKEFLHNIRRVLGPRGVVAMNVIGHKPTGSLESAGGWDGLATRLATVFDQVWVLPLEANTLVFGVLGWPSHVLPPLSTTSLSDQEQVVQDIFDEFRPRMRRVH
ncbi:hypothetical protein B5M09_000868 [Aphanomyces astaci]|uniref:Zinc/iron-chelating domain-containing protein n=1 Tax=Aphanomyces astaci TaxID=112090 RepID=A0A425DF69_APHAT|nr:hypothetical protein B5M09_000868 [Aphanomyces astaci]